MPLFLGGEYDMKNGYVIVVLAICVQFVLLAGCTMKENDSIELASVNGEIIFDSDLDVVKTQYESKNMSDAELLDGLIKERIVLQYDEAIEDEITEDDIENKLQELKGTENGTIFYQKAIEEYGSEEAVRIAMKNRIIYNAAKEDLMDQFSSSFFIDLDKLYLRTEDFIAQYDISELDDNEKEDYKEAVLTQYREALTNELFDLYFQVWLNEQIRSSDIEYLSYIGPLSTRKMIQLSENSVVIDQKEETLQNITFVEAQEVYGNFLYLPNEMEQYDGLKIYGYHDTKEQIKTLRVDYIDKEGGLPVSISLIVSPDLAMGDERIISENNNGENLVEYNIAPIGVRYSISSPYEIEKIEQILGRMIPYTLQ